MCTIFIHSLIHSFIRSFTHSLTQWSDKIRLRYVSLPSRFRDDHLGSQFIKLVPQFLGFQLPVHGTHRLGTSHGRTVRSNWFESTDISRGRDIIFNRFAVGIANCKRRKTSRVVISYRSKSINTNPLNNVCIQNKIVFITHVGKSRSYSICEFLIFRKRILMIYRHVTYLLFVCLTLSQNAVS